MASIGDVARVLRAAMVEVEAASRATTAASEKLEAVVADLAASLAESSNSIAHDGLAQMRSAHELIGEALSTLTAGNARMDAYVLSIAGGGGSSSSANSAQPLRRIDPKALLNLLPTFERVRGAPRPKTRGIFQLQGKRTEIVSGADDSTPEVREHMWDHIGVIRRPATFGADSDVELKAAVKIANKVTDTQQPQHGDVVINNPNGPCEGAYGCDTLLPEFLPPGSTLTVHWPGGEGGAMKTRTYTGTVQSDSGGRTQ